MNKCMFLGRLTRDPETNTTRSGKLVANFSIAINERRKNKVTNEMENFATFLDFECWDKQAELISRFFKKGDVILIEESTAKVDQWEDKETGGKRSKVVFRVDRFQFLPKTTKESEVEEVIEPEKSETTKGKRKKQKVATTAEYEETQGYEEQSNDEDSIPF